MSILRISLEIVERLVVTRLTGLSGIQFFERGRNDPITDDGISSDPWCRLLHVDVEDKVRNTSSVAYGTVTGIVGLAVPGDLIVADAFTLARCLDQLAEVLSYGREVDSPETHDLTFIGCKRVEDIEPVISEAADRWVATGGVMFEANVCCTA